MRLLSAMSSLIVVVLSSSAVCAQSLQSASSQSVPRLINITGVFRPANGQPAGPIETVTLSIYADAERGAPLWQETQTIEIDAQGRYSLLLGATRPDGIPSEVFSGEAAHWLGTVFERAGEVEGPRMRLTSVPYALRAAEAETLGGRPASDYQLAPGADTTDAHAAVADANGVSHDLVSNGAPNLLAKYVNTTDIGPAQMFEAADGAIGLGTTMPFDRIHIRYNNNSGDFTGVAVQNTNPGALAYSGMLFYDHTNALTQFQGYNNATHEYRINNIASGGSINFMLNGSSKFQVRSDGDVEIPGSIRKGGAPFLYSFGIGNTFLGLNTGNITMTGIRNTGIGFEVLQLNTTGGGNTAVGERALVSNSTGSTNSAIGVHALDNNTGGNLNVAIGGSALTQNFTGTGNTAIGTLAMSSNSAGDNNVAIGYQSGLAAISGSNNIYLGTNVWGATNESNAMYLGLQGMQTKTVIAGIRGIATGIADAINVFIDSNGQLGTINSSRRYKQDIQDMGEVSSGLMKLRPVTYRYKQPYANGTKPIDYGLIAEEVESVYPDLVTHLPDGGLETVQYQKINAMLLNEVQKQHRTIEDLKARLATIEALLAAEKKQ